MNTNRTMTPAEFADNVQELITLHSVYAGGPNDCRMWSGPTSHNWGYPVVIIAGVPVNVRQWNAPHADRKRGYSTFFNQTCGNTACINMRHNVVNEIVPVETVRAMEALMKDERDPDREHYDRIRQTKAEKQARRIAKINAAAGL